MRGDVDLPVASEHLHYEYSMLVFTAEQMQAFAQGGDKRTKDAYLESFSVHFRCLRDFFFWSYNPQKADDMLAIDYFDVGAWEKLRPKAIPKSFELRDQVNKEIVHLSYRRAEIQKHRWEFGQVVRDMNAILVTFLSYVVIIKGRPDARKDELVQKKILPESVYNEIKDKIIAKQ